MGSYRFALSFRVFHPTADLSGLPPLLALPLVRSWRAGEPRATPDGKPLGGVQGESYCCMRIPHSDASMLPELLASTLPSLRANEQTLADLVSTGGALSFFIGWFSDGDAGERLAWPLLRELAELRVALELDVYGPDPKGGGAGGAPPVLRGA
jgi:hypothetical protein